MQRVLTRTVYVCVCVLTWCLEAEPRQSASAAVRPRPCNFKHWYLLSCTVGRTVQLFWETSVSQRFSVLTFVAAAEHPCHLITLLTLCDWRKHPCAFTESSLSLIKYDVEFKRGQIPMWTVNWSSPFLHYFLTPLWINSLSKVTV